MRCWWSGRTADDELRGEQRPLRDRSIGNSVEQGTSGGLSELEGGQADGCQRRIEVGRQRDVVEAHDRYVVGHPPIGFAQGVDGAEGEDVAGDEQGGKGGPPEEGVRGAFAARRVEGTFLDQRFVVVDAGCLDRLPVAAQPFVGRGIGQRRIGDEGDPAVAERQADGRRPRPPRPRCRYRCSGYRGRACSPGARPGTRRRPAGPMTDRRSVGPTRSGRRPGGSAGGDRRCPPVRAVRP